MLVAIAEDENCSAVGVNIHAELRRLGQVILDFGSSDPSIDESRSNPAYRVLWSVGRGDADCGIIWGGAAGAPLVDCATLSSCKCIRVITFGGTSGTPRDTVSFSSFNVLCLPAHRIGEELAVELIRSYLASRRSAPSPGGVR